jgi:hypothetical protein
MSADAGRIRARIKALTYFGYPSARNPLERERLKAEIRRLTVALDDMHEPLVAAVEESPRP